MVKGRGTRLDTYLVPVLRWCEPHPRPPSHADNMRPRLWADSDGRPTRNALAIASVSELRVLAAVRHFDAAHEQRPRGPRVLPSSDELDLPGNNPGPLVRALGR